MPQTTVQPSDVEEGLSAECALARRPGYEGLHRDCRQIEDIPVPHVNDMLLVARCRCRCHGGGAR